MTQPIISVCMPTFRRIARCEEAIRSIVAACDVPESIEICLRVQIGDDASIEHIPQFMALAPTVRIVVGLSYGGYLRHHLFFHDVARIADGQWIWLIDDDMTVARGESGIGMDTMMSAQELNAIVLPQHYRLNNSGYDYCTDTPAIFMPANCWMDFEMAKAGPPLDRAIFGVMRKRKFPTRFIDLQYHHHHDSVDEWRAHKAGVT